MTKKLKHKPYIEPNYLSAIDFAYFAHKGQVDKGGVEFYLHPLHVMLGLGPDATDEEKQVAMLHDVLEDTKHTAQDLLDLGFSPSVVDAVVLLTRPMGENHPTYKDWIRSLADCGNITVLKVKLSDSRHNAREDRPLPESESGLRERYIWAIPVLEAALKREEALAYVAKMLLAPRRRLGI